MCTFLHNMLFSICFSIATGVCLGHICNFQSVRLFFFMLYFTLSQEVCPRHSSQNIFYKWRILLKSKKKIGDQRQVQLQFSLMMIIYFAAEQHPHSRQRRNNTILCSFQENMVCFSFYTCVHFDIKMSKVLQMCSLSPFQIGGGVYIFWLYILMKVLL